MTFLLYFIGITFRFTSIISVYQEGYIEEVTRLSQCLNAKTGFVYFWSVYWSFLYWIFMFQIVHFQKILEGQCLNKIRLTAPLYILLDYILTDHFILDFMVAAYYAFYSTLLIGKVNKLMINNIRSIYNCHTFLELCSQKKQDKRSL